MQATGFDWWIEPLAISLALLFYFSEPIIAAPSRASSDTLAESKDNTNTLTK